MLGHLLGLVLSYPVGQTDSVEHSSDSGDPATHRLEPVVIGGKQRRRKYYLQKNYGSPLYHHYPSRVIRPPVNFVANGHPYNIVINPKEFRQEVPTTRVPTTSPPSSPSSTTSRPVALTESPLIWLTNNFLFNGRPAGLGLGTVLRHSVMPGFILM